MSYVGFMNSVSHGLLEVSVVDCPPTVEKFVVCSWSGILRSGSGPWLVLSNEVDDGDSRLVVAVGRLILVICTWRAVVDEAQTMPALVLVVLVQKALVGSIEAVARSSQCLQSPVVSHVRRDDHNTSVEGIGPANIGCTSERSLEIKELIGSAEGDSICVEVDDLAELRLAPEVDLGKGIAQVTAAHQVEVGDVGRSDALHGDNIVIQRLDGVSPKSLSRLWCAVPSTR